MNSQLLHIEPGTYAPTEDQLMPEMPVMSELHRALGEVHPVVGGFLGLQHLFGSTASLIHRIAKNRIAPGNVFLLGKPYSTNPRVADLLHNKIGDTTMKIVDLEIKRYSLKTETEPKK